MQCPHNFFSKWWLIADNVFGKTSLVHGSGLLPYLVSLIFTLDNLRLGNQHNNGETDHAGDHAGGGDDDGGHGGDVGGGHGGDGDDEIPFNLHEKCWNKFAFHVDLDCEWLQNKLDGWCAPFKNASC